MKYQGVCRKYGNGTIAVRPAAYDHFHGMVNMAKSWPRKNQSEHSHLPQYYPAI